MTRNNSILECNKINNSLCAHHSIEHIHRPGRRSTATAFTDDRPIAMGWRSGGFYPSGFKSVYNPSVQFQEFYPREWLRVLPLSRRTTSDQLNFSSKSLKHALKRVSLH